MQIFLLPSSAHSFSFGRIIDVLTTANDEDTLSSLRTKICHIADYGGIPQPPYSSRLRGVDVCEICSKYHHRQLIRVYYYAETRTQRMCLLNYFIKPDGSNSASKYEGRAAMKIEKEMNESISIAVALKAQYPSIHSIYEPFPL